jgi:hypothetical protein
LDEQGRIFDRVWQVFGSMEKSNEERYKSNSNNNNIYLGVGVFTNKYKISIGF